MPKLIDADKLKQHYAWWDNEDKKIFDTIIDLQPEAVVRCKDCKYWEYDVIFSDGWCRGKHQGNPSWFCADGERKDHAETN